MTTLISCSWVCRLGCSTSVPGCESCAGLPHVPSHSGTQAKVTGTSSSHGQEQTWKKPSQTKQVGLKPLLTSHWPNQVTWLTPSSAEWGSSLPPWRGIQRTEYLLNNNALCNNLHRKEAMEFPSQVALTNRRDGYLSGFLCAPYYLNYIPKEDQKTWFLKKCPFWYQGNVTHVWSLVAMEVPFFFSTRAVPRGWFAA